VSLLQTPPLSLYVQLPWCVRKCPYCDVNSHALEGRVPEERYVSALLLDLQAQLADFEPRPVISIFFGGGTPSLFSPAAIGRLLEGVRQCLPVNTDAEITLEANPGTIEHGRFAEYRAVGINRVSVVAVSLKNNHLRRLGRIHDVTDTHRAVDELVTAGLTNFNIDLMYGLPEQSLEQALADIDTAVALHPSHLSHYQLTLEPGTVFFHRPPTLPDDDTSWEMQQRCQERLAEAGYEQYEISGYARRDYRCAHNLNYWKFGDYLGIGAGAHGKVTCAASDEIVRTTIVRQPRQYLQSLVPEESAVVVGSTALATRKITTTQTPRLEKRVLTAQDLPFEFMLNALRLLEGFTRAEFEGRTGLPLSAIQQSLDECATRGLLQPTDTGWRPTDLGLRFLNDLQAGFLSTPPS